MSFRFLSHEHWRSYFTLYSWDFLNFERSRQRIRQLANVIFRLLGLISARNYSQVLFENNWIRYNEDTAQIEGLECKFISGASKRHTSRRCKGLQSHGIRLASVKDRRISNRPLIYVYIVCILSDRKFGPSERVKKLSSSSVMFACYS